jgi:hypothetical protein
MKAALKTGDKEDMLNQQILSLSIGWYLLLQGEYKAVEKVDRMFGQVYEEAEAMHRRALVGSWSRTGTLSSGSACLSRCLRRRAC